jgi:hypothetical protein
MNTSKVLVCVLGAAAAGVITGILLTNGKAAKWMQRAEKANENTGATEKENISKGVQTNEASETAHQRAEFDQASSLGLS